MNTAHAKLLLWLGAGAMAAGAALSLAAALRLPLDVPAAPGAVAVRAAPKVASTQPALESFEAVWDLDLRRPLADPPPATPPPAVALQAALRPAAAPPPVRLVGTVVGGARPRALFLTATGKVEVRSAGEKVAGADVLLVDETTATLSYAGNTIRLKVERVELPATNPARPAPAAAAPNPTTGGGA